MNELTKVNEFRLKLYPKDYYKVREFYERELGYAVINEWDRPDNKGVMFNIGGTTLELLSPESEFKPIAGADVSWKVDDVWKLYETMKNKPYVIRELQDNEWGDTSFHITDPEGFRITFFTKTRN